MSFPLEAKHLGVDPVAVMEDGESPYSQTLRPRTRRSRAHTRARAPSPLCECVTLRHRAAPPPQSTTP